MIEIPNLEEESFEVRSGKGRQQQASSGFLLLQSEKEGEVSFSRSLLDEVRDEYHGKSSTTPSPEDERDYRVKNDGIDGKRDRVVGKARYRFGPDRNAIGKPRSNTIDHRAAAAAYDMMQNEGGINKFIVSPESIGIPNGEDEVIPQALRYNMSTSEVLISNETDATPTEQNFKFGGRKLGVPFKLQDAPIIKERKFQYNGPENRYSAPESENSVMGANEVSNLTVAQQLASPMPDAQAHNRIEPSPQLPPPLSTATNSRVTVSNYDGFTSIRKDLATYEKAPAEYTLHIVFTQFVRHAERKLNLCLEYPLSEEPPIIDILAQGVDPQFDKIISSLGYIARRKPKPVIDSVMFWRKSKSEVVSIAASEVEKVLDSAKSNLVREPLNSSESPVSQPGNKGHTGKAKRSLSLMRSKSISRLTGHSRNQSNSSVSSNKQSSSPKLDSRKSTESDISKQKSYYDDQLSQARELAVQADRKSLALIYILCRVLIEVVKQSSPEVQGVDLCNKLEDIVFTQMKTTDPISTSESLVRSANWNLFAELLGYMSERRFLSVSDRFIANLENIPSSVKQEDEPRLHLLIHGMKYLKLTNYPLERFEESAEFLNSLAKFFEKANSESIVFAYCEVISELVLPLANILTAEANHPTWVEAVEKIYRKAHYLWRNAIKINPSNTPTNVPNYNSVIGTHSNTLSSNVINFDNGWAYSIHVMTSVLSVSPKDHFLSTWFNLVESNNFKLRPKVLNSEKCTFVICLSRLLWVYLYRATDTLNNSMKRLDSLFDWLLFNNNASGKKLQWLNSDTGVISTLVEVIRIVGYLHLNYVLDKVLLQLLKTSFNGSTLEGSNSEKLILVIRAYLVILEDCTADTRPQFPTDDVFTALIMKTQQSAEKRENFYEQFRQYPSSKGLTNIIKNPANAVSHDEICKGSALLLKLLDSQYGSELWSVESNTQNLPATSTSKAQTAFLHLGIDFNYQTTKDIHLILFATLLEAIPMILLPPSADKISTSELPFKTIVEVLTRNAVHLNYRVANAALDSLRKLASRKNSSSLITIFAKYAFQFSDKPGPTYNSDYLNSDESHKLLRIYVELLNCWLHQFKNADKERTTGLQNPLAQEDEVMNKDVLNDLYQINYKTDTFSSGSNSPNKPSDDLEWKTIITVIEEVEGNGLFFLCSQDFQTRHYGISILKIVEQFDQAIYNLTDTTKASSTKDHSRSHSRTSSKFAADIGTRLIHVLEDADFLELIKPYRKELSVPERSRLTKLKNRKNILAKLAASDYGIDSTLWFRLFPKVLDIFFEKCPMPVALCRSIVCVRMVQMYELVFDYSESYKNYTTSIFSRSAKNVPPEVLVNQWRLYLIFACCSLTSTNEQKISFPTQPAHGRKRSAQMFIQHQKITSAKSVFRMVIPFLKSEQLMVREAVKSGLSCINKNIFRTFLENLPDCLNDWSVTEKKRDSGEDRLRIEIIHILCNISVRFNLDPDIYSDEWIIANLVSMIKNTKSFLSAAPIQVDAEFQRLRRYFCDFLENTFTGLQNNSDLNKWLPFEARIGCFNFLKEWCGYGDSKEIMEQRYNTMIRMVSQHKDPTSTVAILEIEKKALMFSSLSTMATLCRGPIMQKIENAGKVAVISFGIPDLMDWIYALISSDDEKVHEIGKIALTNILKINLDNNDVYQRVIKECYASHFSAKITESYFTIFVGHLIDNKLFESTPFDLICLSSILIGYDNYEVRCASMKLLKFLEMKFYGCDTTRAFETSVCNKTRVVYKKALFDISVLLASAHPGDAFENISYLTMFFNVVSIGSRRDILSCLLPWVQKIELKYDIGELVVSGDAVTTKSPELNASSRMVLNNLFEITVKFSTEMLNEVEALWVAIGRISTNFDTIIDYIIYNSLKNRNPIFIEFSRQIVDHLSFSQPDTLYIIDKLIGNLQPKAMIPPQCQNETSTQDSENNFPYVANLLHVIPSSEKDGAISVGKLSVVFLVDLLTIRNDRVLESLPLLLHVAFVLLDHYLPFVQELAVTLLIQLIHSLAPDEAKSASTLSSLRLRDSSKNLWAYDDLNNDKKGARTPKNMDWLTRSILEIFSKIQPSLQEDWSRVSLSWATTCAVRHIACRSFQLFRSLLSFLDQGMLKDMLHRLSNTISDETVDIQGFAMQILMTLNAITAELSPGKLIDFPQLFWSNVACLSTINEQEYVEVLSTMSKFVSKIDIDSPDTVSCLISTFPPKWEGKFEGLQQIVMGGLRSSIAWEPCLKFLDKLNGLHDSEIVGLGDHRLLMSVLANMPRFLHAADQKNINAEIQTTALALAGMADRHGKQGLSRILNSLSKNKFRSKKDFLVQTVSTIENLFFPEFEAQTLVFLLGLLSNKISWVKLETMSLLKHILPSVDLQREEFVGVGADLISPLLRLLLIDYAEPALEVLDEAVTISGSKLDKDVLRLSLGNMSMKKKYENTATLFGIPEETGWSIPMPAVTAASTRNNVHAVFSTCTMATIVDENTESLDNEEDIQFHLEEYYAPPGDHADSISAGIEEPDDSLSNMWAALDDFDSFFTKDTDQNGVIHRSHFLGNKREVPNYHGHSASLESRFSNSSDFAAPMDSAPQVYDNKASVILNRSLARTQSNTSFKNGLSDFVSPTATQSIEALNAPKRSYIPFRNVKPINKSKADKVLPGSIPSSPIDEFSDRPSPYRSPAISTSTLSPRKEHSASPNLRHNELGKVTASQSESITILENLIHGGKRRAKKSTLFSPNNANFHDTNAQLHRKQPEKSPKSPRSYENENSH